MKTILIPFIALIFFFGCGGSSSSENNSTVNNTTTSVEEPQESLSEEDNNSEENSLQTTTPIIDTSTQEGTDTTSSTYTLDEILEEPYIKTQWAVFYDEESFNEKGIDTNASINANEVYLNYTGKNIRIAVIDNGFDVNHPELQGRVHSTHNFSETGDATDVSHTSSSDNHGTAVAGIIAANMNKEGIRGVAPNAELILIKFGESNSDIDFINMFKAAVDNGADIINCSWGTGNVPESVSSYLSEIATTGRDGKGILIIFSTGNDNSNLANDESSLESVIGVGATDHDNLRTSYSNYGPDIDIMVPGGGSNLNDYGISTIDPLSSSGATTDDYNLYNENNTFIGTSASAPILSGALALLLESNLQLTREEIMEKIRTHSDKISENVPYILDIETYGSTTVTLSGELGTSGYSDFQLRVTPSSSSSYSEYDVDIEGNSWSKTLTLEEGFYKAELVSTTRRLFGGVTTTYFATDSQFEVNSAKETVSKGLRNDYYGYGKLNLYNLINF